MRAARDADGGLTYADINIVNHYMDMDFVERVSRETLPYHTAFKAVRYLGRDGKHVDAKEPNAYKFESFLFDAFVRADRAAVLRVERNEEFAPVKNRTGPDSPETASRMFRDATGRGLR